MTLSLEPTSRTTARITRDGIAVGHIGLMSGCTMAYVNLAFTFGVAFAAHSTTLQDAFDEAIKALTRKGVL